MTVVSGRSAQELLAWLGPDVEIWGLHGAERCADGTVELSQRAARFLEPVASAAAELRARLAGSDLRGVLLESKGVMLALHFRNAPDVAAAQTDVEQLASEVARRHGLRLARGRLVVELRPPEDFGKHQVVLERTRELNLRAAAFVGDDRVDLPAFDALDELESEGVATLRVAVRSHESPPELLERADLVVEGPSGVTRLLEQLAGGRS